MKNILKAPVPYGKEVEKLIEIYIEAEKEIFNTISYKRTRDLIDYGNVAALERVQVILNDMISEARLYIPLAIKRQYYMGLKHETGLANAVVLTTTESRVVEVLTSNLLGTISEAATNANNYIIKTWYETAKIGRLKNDVFRKTVLESQIRAEATGAGIQRAKSLFLQKMGESGIVAFTDAIGRKWTLRNYAEMATRTVSRQATNVGMLYADQNHDLYKVSAHGTTCKLCAPYENRVFSRDGTNKDYPNMVLLFGKIDPKGPDTLDNSWLNIHPNCFHVLTKYTEEGKSAEEIQKVKDFSNFSKNPITNDPRTEAQIKAYRNKERARQKLLRDVKEYEKLKLLVLGMPKTFQTFEKHKLANSDKYQKWKASFKQLKQNEI